MLIKILVIDPLNLTTNKIDAKNTSSNLDLNISNADVLLEKEILLGSGNDIQCW